MSTRKQPRPAKGAKRLSWKANLLFAAVILTAAALLVFLLRPRSKAEPLAAVVDFGGGITEAEGTVGTPYGVIKAAWKIADGEMTMTVAVPVGTECTVVLPSGEEKVLGSGEYTVTAKA